VLIHKIWNAENGECYHTLRGHSGEVLCVTFNNQSSVIATGSMDSLCILWDVRSGDEMFKLMVIFRNNCSSFFFFFFFFYF